MNKKYFLEYMHYKTKSGFEVDFFIPATAKSGLESDSDTLDHDGHTIEVRPIYWWLLQTLIKSTRIR